MSAFQQANLVKVIFKKALSKGITGIVLSIFGFCVLMGSSCRRQQDVSPVDAGFDRAAMLSTMADQIIVPAYDTCQFKLSSATRDLDTFLNNPTEAHLLQARSSILKLYLQWQVCEPFEIGPAETKSARININYLDYALDSTNIQKNINAGNVGVDFVNGLVGNQKGFPALDWVLFNKYANNTDIVNAYIGSANRKAYTRSTLQNIQNILTYIRNQWAGSYRQEFLSKTGDDASSSIVKMTNRFMSGLDLVKRERTGNPLGYVGNTALANTKPSLAEAFHANYSLTLIVKNLQNLRILFKGRQGTGFDDWLNFIKATKDGQTLSGIIDQQFQTCLNAYQAISPDLNMALSTNKPSVVLAFNEMKTLVALVKVDMISSLGLVIGFSDADGD